MDPKVRKALIPLALFLAGSVSGGIGMWSVHHVHARRALHPDPAKKLFPKRVMNELEKDFVWYPFPEEREDIAVDDSGRDIVYRVPIENIKEKKVKVDVEDGVVTVTAKSHQTTETKGEDSPTMNLTDITTQYQKTFPLVAGANPAKMDYTIEQDTLVIRFSKLKGV